MVDDSSNETPNLPAVPDDPGQFILYQTEDGRTRVEVRFFRETVWLSQKTMAELFQKDVRTINEHIRNIFSEGELHEPEVIRNFRITASDGKQYDTLHWNATRRLRGSSAWNRRRRQKHQSLASVDKRIVQVEEKTEVVPDNQ